MFEKPFLFIKSTFKGALNIYSGVSFILILLSIFIEIPVKYKQLLQYVLLFSIIYYATYLAWGKIYDLVPQNGELKFNIQDVEFNTGKWWNGVPRNPMFKFMIDIKNTNDEKQIITEISIERYKLNTNAITLNKNSLLFYKVNPQVSERRQRLEMPIDILERDHLILSLEINAQYNQGNIEVIQQFIDQEVSFLFYYKVLYSDVYNNKRESGFTIKGDYSEFKKNFIKMLRNYGKRELVSQLTLPE